MRKKQTAPVSNIAEQSRRFGLS